MQRVEVDVVPGVGEEAVHGCEVVAAGGDVVDVDLPVAHRPVGGPRQRVGHLLWGWPVACELDALAEEGRAAAQHCGYQRAEVCEGDLLQGALGRQRKRELAGGGDLCWVAEVLEEVRRCEDRVWDRAARSRRSMVALLSKCGTPVWRSALATKARISHGIWTSLAAAMSASPWRISSPGPAANGVVTA